MIRENCTMTRASSGTQVQDSVKKSCTRAPNFWPASRVSRKVNCNWPTYPSSPGFKSTLAIAIMIDLRVDAWKYARFMSIMARQYCSGPVWPLAHMEHKNFNVPLVPLSLRYRLIEIHLLDSIPQGSLQNRSLFILCRRRWAHPRWRFLGRSWEWSFREHPFSSSHGAIDY